MLWNCVKPGLTPTVHRAEGNFQADTLEDFQSLLLKTDACGYLYEMEYSKENLKHREEEKEEVATAVGAERQTQPVAKVWRP